MATLLLYVVAVLGLSVLVIVHELGHYLVARAFEMRVLRFSIGFGPAIFRYRPKDSPTTFQVCAIPLLAYVQIAGMNPAEEQDPSDEGLFPNKGVFARIATIAAGPAANYLAASVIIFFLALTGWPIKAEMTSPMEVGEVVKGSPAEAAGIEAGDKILEANGRPVANVSELIEATKANGVAPMTLVIDRDGERRTLRLTPRLDPEGVPKMGVGAASRAIREPQPLGTALEYAVTKPAVITAMTIAGLIDMIKQRTTDGLISPVGMTREVARSAKRGVFDMFWLLMNISIAIGFFNLLPFPALDGGRLAFLGFELVTRRRPNERFEALVHMVGLVMLLSLVVVVMIRGQ
jgi:regulator of sigma E protease